MLLKKALILLDIRVMQNALSKTTIKRKNCDNNRWTYLFPFSTCCWISIRDGPAVLLRQEAGSAPRAIEDPPQDLEVEKCYERGSEPELPSRTKFMVHHLVQSAIVVGTWHLFRPQWIPCKPHCRSTCASEPRELKLLCTQPGNEDPPLASVA